MEEQSTIGTSYAPQLWLVRHVSIIALVLAPLLNGCAGLPQDSQQAACGGLGAGVNKTDIGILAGTIVGAALGDLLARSQNKVAGLLLGGAAGAALGGSIGAKLDAEDCAAMTAALDRSLQYNRDGGSTDWSASKADINARFEPSQSYTETREVAIALGAGVTAPDDLVVVGRIGYAADQADILSAPEGGSTLGTLYRGEAVRIVGHPAADPDYDLIARAGLAIGYVQAAEITRRPVTSDASTPQNMAAVAPVRVQPDLDSVGGDTAPVVHVNADVSCRSVNTQISGSGGSQTSSETACQTPDGAWNINPESGGSVM
jgi:surface antigen